MKWCVCVWGGGVSQHTSVSSLLQRRIPTQRAHTGSFLRSMWKSGRVRQKLLASKDPSDEGEAGGCRLAQRKPGLGMSGHFSAYLLQYSQSSGSRTVDIAEVQRANVPQTLI